MAQVDFDVESLAEYLHLSAAQVTRMAERDKLPGRKLGGLWRFSPGEIHHWLERRIGASDEAELLEVEGVLERKLDESERALSIAALLPVTAVAIPLQARTRESVISSMVELAMKTERLWDPNKLAEALRTRENLHPTALDNGVALLHPRRPLVNVYAEPFLALGRTERGIPFGHSRGVLTDVFILICSTDDSGHLRVLARLSRLLAAPDFLAGLHAARDAHEVHRLLEGFETKLA